MGLAFCNLRGVLSVAFGCLCRVQCAVAGITLGPDQKQDILAAGGGVDLAGELVGRGCGVAVDFEDDVSGLEAGIFCRAAGTDLLDDGSL